MRGFWLLSVGLLGCMPAMLSTPVSSFSFASEERCAQGPFEVTLTTQEAPYGQYLKVRLREGASQAQLHYRIDGLPYSVTGLIGTTQKVAGTDANGNNIYEPFTPPSPCLAQKGPDNPGEPYAGVPGGEAPGVPTVVVTSEGSPPMAQTPPIREVEFVDSPYDYGTDTFRLDLPDLPPGTVLKVTLWSDLPYQLNDARISVSLHMKYPKDPEKYALWEAKKEAREAQKAERRQERRVQASARKQEKAAKASSIKKRERRTARLIARAERYWQEFIRVDASLLAELEGLSGEALLAIEKKRYAYFQQYAWKIDGLYDDMPQNQAKEEFARGAVYQELSRLRKEWNAWAQANFPPPTVEEAIAEKPKPTPPPGPPPLPWAEEKGLPPVASAVWRSGYWEWNGFHWVWTSGAWEIPPGAKPTPTEESVIAQRPAPKAEEIPPPPAPDHVWIGGAWRWDGRGFIWVSGHWAPLVVPVTPAKNQKPSSIHKATPR